MTKASEISWKYLSIYLSHFWCSTNLHSSALGCITLDQDCTIAINQELSRIGLHCHIIHEGLQSWRTVSVTTSSQWSGSCVGCCFFFFFSPQQFPLFAYEGHCYFVGESSKVYPFTLAGVRTDYLHCCRQRCVETFTGVRVGACLKALGWGQGL